MPHTTTSIKSATPDQRAFLNALDQQLALPLNERNATFLVNDPNFALPLFDIVALAATYGYTDNLNDIDFSQLTQKELTYIQLANTNLDRCNIDGLSFVQSKLTGNNRAPNADNRILFDRVTFTHCDVSNSLFFLLPSTGDDTNTPIVMTILDCQADGVELESFATLTNSQLHFNSFRNSKFQCPMQGGTLQCDDASDANFEYNYFSYTTIKGAYPRTNFYLMYFYRCTIAASLIEADFTSATLDTTQCSDCDLTRTYTNIPPLKIIDSTFTRCSFYEANLPQVNITGPSVFDHCDMTSTILTQASILDCKFPGCRLFGTNFYASSLTDIDFQDIEVSSAYPVNMNATTLIRSDLRNIPCHAATTNMQRLYTPTSSSTSAQRETMQRYKDRENMTGTQSVTIRPVNRDNTANASEPHCPGGVKTPLLVNGCVSINDDTTLIDNKGMPCEPNVKLYAWLISGIVGIGVLVILGVIAHQIYVRIQRYRTTYVPPGAGEIQDHDSDEEMRPLLDTAELSLTIEPESLTNTPGGLNANTTLEDPELSSVLNIAQSSTVSNASYPVIGQTRFAR